MRLVLLPLGILSLSVAVAAPLTVSVDLSSPLGPVKPLNGVNNGPSGSARAPELGNSADFAALAIPFVRTHDSSFNPGYGGEHSIDISAVFPDFSADENDPKAYDFTFTDGYLASIRASGAKIYYRLGQKIEHGAKKYHTKPADFAKWARICEKVMDRYPDVAYWEIWNEPDHSDATWGGMPAEFYDFYETVAKHLKAKFPDRRIGGPAIAGSQKWGRKFLVEMRKREVPIDFVSWHLYTADPKAVATKAAEWRKLIDDCGYPQAESHLTEWNYIRGWRCGDYVASMRAIGNETGAAFTAAFLVDAQAAPVDMMAYYDARPSGYNGLFDPANNAPRPTYWAFDAWRTLRSLSTSVAVRTEDASREVRCAAACDGRRFALLVVRFSGDLNQAVSREVTVDLGSVVLEDVTVKTLDSRHAFQARPAVVQDGRLSLSLEPRSFALVEGRLTGRTADVAAWNALGFREETLAFFKTNVFGNRPVERPAQLSFAPVGDDVELFGGTAFRRDVRISYGGPYGTNSFVVTAVVPRREKKVPAFLLINRLPAERYLQADNPRSRGYWPVEEIVRRGYAAISFFYGDVAPDRSSGNTEGVFPCFEDMKIQYRPKDNWGTLSAWAWGASRVMDWIETEPLLDAAHVAVVGHSRGGKASLWTGVTDTRFAMACVNGSGCAGAKLNAMDLPQSEHIVDIVRTFSYWFAPNYIRYVNRDDALPFDQHQLLALMAPRLLCVGSGSTDHWAGPAGERESCVLASPAWEAQGKKGLADGGSVSYHKHEGGHGLRADDWKVYLDFADAHGWQD